jgi:hypothetical protein
MEVTLLHEFTHYKINYIPCLHRDHVNCIVLWANTDVSEENPANIFSIEVRRVGNWRGYRGSLRSMGREGVRKCNFLQANGNDREENGSTFFSPKDEGG